MTAICKLLERVGIGEGEFGDFGAAQGTKMGAATQTLSHVVRYGAQVRPGGDAGAKASAVPFHFQDLKFLDLDLHRLEGHFFLLAGQLVGWNPVNLLGGKWGRSLANHSAELGGESLDFIGLETNVLGCADRFALGVVGIGGEAEADRAFVGFLGFGVELSETSKVADDQGQDAGCHGIERTEMADGALAEDAAGAVDHIMGG